MSLSVGIVGLPNVGKSTLFNALTSSAAAESANYPFCTIDPNVGVVTVPDPRLAEIRKYIVPQKLIPAAVDIVDIAGLVKGASKGEGLGNTLAGCAGLTVPPAASIRVLVLSGSRFLTSQHELTGGGAFQGPTQHRTRAFGRGSARCLRGRCGFGAD